MRTRSFRHLLTPLRCSTTSTLPAFCFPALWELKAICKTSTSYVLFSDTLIRLQNELTTASEIGHFILPSRSSSLSATLRSSGHHPASDPRSLVPVDYITVLCRPPPLWQSPSSVSNQIPFSSRLPARSHTTPAPSSNIVILFLALIRRRLSQRASQQAGSPLPRPSPHLPTHTTSGLLLNWNRLFDQRDDQVEVGSNPHRES